ncbi:MAG TPA: heme exporter protein CcmB [Limnobacter sp.]|nr:heme exporter protein CcmB [Limnobacter sp.]
MIKAGFSADMLHIQCAGLSAGGVDLSGSLDFELKAGNLNILRGANGAGKSTLLKGLANALPVQSVLFKPEFGLRDEMLVDEHLKILLHHLGQDQEEITGLLALIGLAELQYERIGTLSSGQRARLGLCVLKAGGFKLWLLDEPLNALDAEGIRIFAGLVSAHLQHGGYLFMATHVDPGLLTSHLKGTAVVTYLLEQGMLKAGPSGQDASHTESIGQSGTQPLLFPESMGSRAEAAAYGAFLFRDFRLFLGSPQMLLWGALFHWMVLSFFGIGLGKASVEFTQVAIWTSLLLAVVLSAKDWFVEDHRVGWMGLLSSLHADNIARYWFVRIVWTVVCQIAVLVPVTGLASLQFGLQPVQILALIAALAMGVLAAVPLLGLLSLLVMLTRGGAVLVYLLALPLLVPVLIFGLEASRAADLGRTATAPLTVLGMLGLLLLLLGPVAAKRLVNLIQE